jgi:hypothetical protein
MEEQTEGAAETPAFLVDDEFVDVDALYAEVRTLQHANEAIQERANADREMAFKKIRSLQKNLEQANGLIEKLKKIESAYYGLRAENAGLRELTTAVRAWAKGPAAEARNKLYQTLAVVDGAAGTSEES